jgi:hypothetical protein
MMNDGAKDLPNGQMLEKPVNIFGGMNNPKFRQI